MNNRYHSIDEIMKSDLFEDITSKTKKINKVSYDPEIEKFREIIDFVKENGREPYKVDNNWEERKLASRLIGIRKDGERLNYLKQYDEIGLLGQNKKGTKIPEVNSVEDILLSGSSELLRDSSLENGKKSIFDTSSIRKPMTMPGYIAKRKKIKDFDRYEKLFKTCQKDIAEGKRKLLQFKNEQDIHPNNFYVLNGVLLYVESVGERKKVNNKTNARLKCIFENGTESDMLLRSLSAELYKNGRRVTENEDTLLDNIGTDDVATGFIYVLKSLSEDVQISSIKNLYKIGFTTGAVENRIKNAEKQATFLYAPVEVVATYQVFNLNVSRFETLLHRILSHKNVNISIVGPNGKTVVPREWFVSSLEEVEEVINDIVMKINL